MAVQPTPPPPTPPGPPPDVGPQLPAPVPYERAEFAAAIVFSVLAEARARLAQIDRALGLPNGRGTNTYCDIVSIGGARYAIPILPMASGRATPAAAERYCRVLWDTVNGVVTGAYWDKRANEAPTPDVAVPSTMTAPSSWA